MPNPKRDEASPPSDPGASSLPDHASIQRLTEDLVPALIAKLGASGLGEIEVREGNWKIRLRRPTGSGSASARRSADRASWSGPGWGQPSASSPSPDSGGSLGQLLTPVGPGRGADGAASEASDESMAGRDPYRSAAVSPAVGYYQPKPGLAPGSRVRAGDPVGTVDVLGIPQEVVAPADGIVGASLAEPGQAVEYGQELVWIEQIASTPVAGREPADRTGGSPSDAP